MQDGPLSLLDIIDTDISGHEFAFLSACETAMGDRSAPDEVIHLAAGLQFMGVKSVIGTLWSVGDKVARDLVSAFYKELCKDGTMDCTMAARALHKAVATLAGDKVEAPAPLQENCTTTAGASHEAVTSLANAKYNVPLQERAVFVHTGI
ncbi:hypothetical protein HYDPIDRAFT_30037 [Hydnomerulius pinastri MD-312]|uniref:CHAT domain-containing protein n=1 Tax=Hydnomerulius pinastri MD-312 TaxID=994086 RepID=A0A0C9WDB8_9AGAM|nr:hypothetical protein HYDPIDRAFT_30037 [Hydnomerulius pinastri MD-312]